MSVPCARRDHDDGSWDRKPECARSGSAARGQALATRRTRKHRGNLATTETERVDSMEWPACPRSPRRPTRRNGTTPDNQRSLPRPLPAGVRSAQRWRKTEALSPRATRARAPVGVAGGGRVCPHATNYPRSVIFHLRIMIYRRMYGLRDPSAQISSKWRPLRKYRSPHLQTNTSPLVKLDAFISQW